MGTEKYFGAVTQKNNSHGISGMTIDLYMKTKEPNAMKTQDRGQKHICPKCAIKYFDLNKVVVACPGCGAKPPPTQFSKSTPPAQRKSQGLSPNGRTTFGKYR